MSNLRPILSLNNLTLGYKGRGDVFRGINAELRPGELVALLGANGSGKSTLLKALSGNLRPDGGSIEIAGKSLSKLSAMELARLVSIVTTEKAAVGGLTVEEVVSMGRYPHTGSLGRHNSTDRQIIAEAIDAVGLTPLSKRLMATLSDGERQKAMIARALAQQTMVMLLDEPTAFLDAASRIETLSLLRKLAIEGSKAVLLSTHDIAPAMSLSTQLWLVKNASDGLSTLITGTPQSLAENPDGLPSLFSGRPVCFSTDTHDFIPLR